MKQYATRYVGCSRQACIDHYGIASDAEIFYNGFDTDEFLQMPFQRDDYLFLTIGRITYQKNPDFIISIMKELSELDSRYRLVWIGEGNLKEAAVKKIRDLRIENKIQMIGATTHTQPYFEKCAYALFPSRYEGLGIAIVECQMAHCYVFMSDVIPQEADLGFCEKISLKKDAKEWAEFIHASVTLKQREKVAPNEKQAMLYSEDSVKKHAEALYNVKK